MKLIRLIGLVSILSVAAFGQRGGFRSGFGGGFHGGFGGFHGGFGGFRGGFGGFRGGFGGFRGGFIGGGFRFGHFRGAFGTFPGHRFFGTRFFQGSPFFSPGFVYPYYYPFDLGFDYSAPYEYAPAPNTTIIYLPPPSGGPEYISQPTYTPETAKPLIRDYSQTTRKPIYFPLARRDGTVEKAAAFWIEGGTLHYIDLDGDSGTIPFSEVDRGRTDQLNRDRGIEFRLPASPR